MEQFQDIVHMAAPPPSVYLHSDTEEDIASTSEAPYASGPLIDIDERTSPRMREPDGVHDLYMELSELADGCETSLVTEAECTEDAILHTPPLLISIDHTTHFQRRAFEDRTPSSAAPLPFQGTPQSQKNNASLFVSRIRSPLPSCGKENQPGTLSVEPLIDLENNSASQSSPDPNVSLQPSVLDYLRSRQVPSTHDVEKSARCELKQNAAPSTSRSLSNHLASSSIDALSRLSRQRTVSELHRRSSGAAMESSSSLTQSTATVAIATHERNFTPEPTMPPPALEGDPRSAFAPLVRTASPSLLLPTALKPTDDDVTSPELKSLQTLPNIAPSSKRPPNHTNALQENIDKRMSLESAGPRDGIELVDQVSKSRNENTMFADPTQRRSDAKIWQAERGDSEAIEEAPVGLQETPSDDENELEETAVPPKKLSHRKQAERAAFEANFVEHLYRKAADMRQEAEQIDAFEDRSTSWLYKHSNENIISSPREYQIELYEMAKERNIIAILDTGSGKTLIAVLLLRFVFEQELERRAKGLPKRMAFFLVHSVTLVYQQFAVLECNLGQPMDKFCGGLNSNLWSKQHWDDQLERNMAVVCTADVLHHCLHHGFINMSQINLLIFDEAHHAKKNHVYSRIFKDFYINSPDSTRLPKIFGMTASPVDSKTDVREAAAQLETLLHAQIATASDPSLLQFAPVSKQESIARYKPLARPYVTPLCAKISAQFKERSVMGKELTFAKEASSQLGAWCSDQIWPMSLTEEKCLKLQAKIERKFHAKNAGESMSVLEARKAEVDTVRTVVEAHEFNAPRPTLQDLSTKVAVLMEFLKERFERVTNDKCIVFVTQRFTAKILTELFKHTDIGTPHLRPAFFVGSMSDDVGDIQVNFRQQVLTLVKFRKGDYNCLFATSVAEEGLDVPDCNLVIRFDLYTTLIQHIQSRGRARLPNSVYVHMMEEDNREHVSLVKDVRNNEGILRKFCQNLDPDRLLSGNSYDLDFFLAKEKKHRVYIDPQTGSKLTYRLSLMVLENFVASLPTTEDDIRSASYIMTTRGKEFCCEVILPSNSPVQSAIGRPATTKQVAKCSAAFTACLSLRKGGHLDAHFRSTFVKQKLVMQNAHLAVNSKKRAKYDMRTKPRIWSLGTMPEEWFLTVLTLSDASVLDRASQPLGLISRTHLPHFPQFPLFFGKHKTSNVVCCPLDASFTLDKHKLEQVNCFTLRIFRDVFSKEYECDISKMPYFLVPVASQAALNPACAAKSVIAWNIIEAVHNVEAVPLDFDAPDAFYEDRYIVDSYDGSRKLWSISVSKEHKPSDPLPPGVTPRVGGRKDNSTITGYSSSLWAKARAKRHYREDQKVIRAELIPLRRNLLDDTYVEGTKSEFCYVILEPLLISALPTKVVTMAYVFPAIIHRLESYLIALEVCDLLGLQIEPGLALEAVTKDSDNTEEHSNEQIQFQRGMGKNYERLEFLGDCFLKMATSTSLFSRHPDKDENNYHVDRMLMLCNQNLLNVALGPDLKLSEFIRSQSFNRRAWYPEGLVLKRGKTATAATTHDLADKTIADVSEALIGAALLSGGFDQAVRAVKILVSSDEHPMACWKDYYEAYNKPRYQLAPSTASQNDMAAKIEMIHPYHFKHNRLLRSAFTHPSYPFSWEHVPSYQRLEFLGDSVLDMVCITYLYHTFPTRDPQWLTEHKMAMVANQFLGALCVHLGFHKFLLQFNPKISAAIAAYVDEITLARESAEQDAVLAGKLPSECIPDYWSHTKQPPKCLPDIVEAYIGAIFVDSEYNYSEIERFFDMRIKWFFKDMNIYDTFANKHPVTFMTNFLEINMGCRNFSVCAKELPDLGDGATPMNLAMVLIHGQMVASKEGASQRYAKVAVAKMAMNRLEGMSLPEFRMQYHCDCKRTIEDDVGEEDSALHGTAI